AAVLEDGMNRKFHRNAACLANALAHAADCLEMDAIAGREVATGLRDADDRFTASQLLAREPVVHEALEIERHHVEVRGIVEPVLGAEAARRTRIRAHERFCSAGAPGCQRARG